MILSDRYPPTVREILRTVGWAVLMAALAWVAMWLPGGWSVLWMLPALAGLVPLVLLAVSVVVMGVARPGRENTAARALGGRTRREITR